MEAHKELTTESSNQLENESEDVMGVDSEQTETDSFEEGCGPEEIIHDNFDAFRTCSYLRKLVYKSRQS